MWIRWARGVEVSDERWYRRCRLIESLHQLALFLVEFLHFIISEVFADLIKVFLSSVKQRNPDMGLLQSADIIRAVASHEGMVPSIFETHQDFLFLLWRNASINPCMPK